MPPSADALFDRKRLKAKLRYWRSLAILMVAVTAGLWVWQQTGGPAVGAGFASRDFIARINVSGIIVDDSQRNTILRDIADNKRIKAVLVELDTPGGTTVGGEELYVRLRAIAEKKPVVALMRTVCASAGYMAALGADHLVARETTLTGSIGVILQSFEVSELAENLGIDPLTIKAGTFKDSPPSFREVTEQDIGAIQPVVDDTHEYFISLVAKHRKLQGDALSYVTTGRVFTGRQAQKVGLIDTLGGQEEALAWLHKEHNLNTDKLKVREIKEEESLEDFFKMLGSGALAKLLIKLPNSLDGLVSIWHPVTY